MINLRRFGRQRRNSADSKSCSSSVSSLTKCKFEESLQQNEPEIPTKQVKQKKRKVSSRMKRKKRNPKTQSRMKWKKKRSFSNLQSSLESIAEEREPVTASDISEEPEKAETASDNSSSSLSNDNSSSSLSDDKRNKTTHADESSDDFFKTSPEKSKKSGMLSAVKKKLLGKKGGKDRAGMNIIEISTSQLPADDDEMTTYTEETRPLLGLKEQDESLRDKCLVNAMDCILASEIPPICPSEPIYVNWKTFMDTVAFPERIFENGAPPLSQASETVVCELFKETKDERIGIIINHAFGKKGIFISKLVCGSKGEAANLKPGMQLLAINDIPCPVTVEETVTLISHLEGKVKLAALPEVPSLFDSVSDFAFWSNADEEEVVFEEIKLKNETGEDEGEQERGDETDDVEEIRLENQKGEVEGDEEREDTESIAATERKAYGICDRGRDQETCENSSVQDETITSASTWESNSFESISTISKATFETSDVSRSTFRTKTTVRSMAGDEETDDVMLARKRSKSKPTATKSAPASQETTSKSKVMPTASRSGPENAAAGGPFKKNYSLDALEIARNEMLAKAESFDPSLETSPSLSLRTFQTTKGAGESVGISLIQDEKSLSGIYVNSVAKNSKFASVLNVGMKISAINGKPCPATVDAAIHMISNTVGLLELTFESEEIFIDDEVDRVVPDDHEVIGLITKRRDEPIGFLLKTYQYKKGIYVNRIMKYSKFASTPLKPGMKILSINGQECPKNVNACMDLIDSVEGALEIAAENLP